jgi:hypothetical protein
MANVARPWQNIFREDVNNDGLVTPSDALFIINSLNSRGSRVLAELPTGDDFFPPFIDPSGDGLLAPVDPLFVINFINGGGNTEGEAGAPRTQLAPQDLSLADPGDDDVPATSRASSVTTAPRQLDRPYRAARRSSDSSDRPRDRFFRALASVEKPQGLLDSIDPF